MAIKIEYADPVYKGRTLRVTGYVRHTVDDPREILVTLNYVDNRDGQRVDKAIILDGQILPAIIKAFKRRK